MIIAQVGECHLSLTSATFSGIILSKDMANKVLDETRRNGGMSFASQITPAKAISHESHPKSMPLAMRDAIPVLHAAWKLIIPAFAIAASDTPPRLM